ncbi:MAG: integrase arm-type DNA-binding domain-containing protein [Sphingomicrobium sp.]
MAVGRISKRSVDALKPGQADLFLWDDEVSGFGLKLTPNGRLSYILQYRMGGRGTPTRRYTIGRHGTWTPDEARTEAKRLRQIVDRGNDPQQADRERQRQEVDLAFGSYLDRFLEQYGKNNWSAGTYGSAESNLRRFVKPVLGRKSLPSIARRDIQDVFDKLPAGKPALPRNVFAHTRKLFAWAVERGDLERSPFDGMKSPPSVASRERVLTDAELRLALLAADKLDAPFRALVRLLARLGQRRDEVAAMEWAELDRSAALWTIPGRRTKNGETQIMPLSAADIADLDAIAGADPAAETVRWPRKGYVLTTNGKTPISGFSKTKARLDDEMLKIAREDAKKAGEDVEDVTLEPWRLHDLRRTLATGMQRLGVRFEVTEAILNHVSGSKAGVAGVYQRHHWTDEKRSALAAWERHLAALLAPSTERDNVVVLHG